MQPDPFQADRDQVRRRIGRLRRRLDSRMRTAIGLPTWFFGQSSKSRSVLSLSAVLAAIVGWLWARRQSDHQESNE